MANAIVRVSDVNSGTTGPTLYLSAIYSGDDIGTLIPAIIEVPLRGTESATEMRTAMSNAVAAWPAQNGHTWTVAGTAMVLPTFQKG